VDASFGGALECASTPVPSGLMLIDADWGGQPGSRLGLDIGGTLAKLVFFESETRPSWCNGRIAELIHSFGDESLIEGRGKCSKPKLTSQRSFRLECDRELSLVAGDLGGGGRLHFLTFHSGQMERFVALMERHQLHAGMREIFTTGGGAFKYAALFKEHLGVELIPVDELEVVVRGIAWIVERPLGAAGGGSSCWLGEVPPCDSQGVDALFPFILVNIGSGVSIVRVDGLDAFERVGGSAIGGGTFWGLCRQICPSCSEFEQAGRLAEECEDGASSVNLLVEDIYGGDYTMPNGAVLPGSLTASFFAKAAMPGAEHRSDASLLHALTKMVSANICQIAHLNARIQKVSRVIFTGNFLRQNPVARESIATNMRRVSSLDHEAPYEALFLQHEGYFGALGTFLHNVRRELDEERVPVSKRMTSTVDVRQCSSESQSIASKLRRMLLAGPCGSSAGQSPSRTAWSGARLSRALAAATATRARKPAVCTSCQETSAVPVSPIVVPGQSLPPCAGVLGPAEMKFSL